MKGRKTCPRTTFIGKALTEKRQQLGLSQQKLCSMTGLSLRGYQRLETGETEFRDTRMRFGLAICTILGMDPYMMVFGHEFTYGAVLDIEDESSGLSQSSDM